MSGRVGMHRTVQEPHYRIGVVQRRRAGVGSPQGGLQHDRAYAAPPRSDYSTSHSTGSDRWTNERNQTSIVVGAYNGAQYIEEQLESLVAQTIPTCEIVVADDRSKDDTVARVEAFARRCPIPVILRRNENNLGFAENFLQAAVIATGVLIAFCDQDDRWHPEKIEACQEALTRSGAFLAVHTANLIDTNGVRIGPFSQGIGGDAVREPLSYGPWHVFFGFSMVFDRRLLDLVPSASRGIDYIMGKPGLSHDRWILFLANLVGSVVELDRPLVDYRQHGGNLFGSARSGHRKRRERVAVESDWYLQAAKEQRAIVDAVAASPLIGSTQFDRARAVDYWDAAVDQQSARNRLYTAASTSAEARQWVKNVLGGVYRTLPDGRHRAKAALKDLKYIVDGVRDRS